MITVIGLGFVGLTTALGFSSKGYPVYGFESDKKKANLLGRAAIPFLEPGLGRALKHNLNKNFFLDCDLNTAVRKSSFIFFCVGTPSDKEGNADLSYLKNAIKQVLDYIPRNNFKVLVVKSTIPPSTSEKSLKCFIEKLGFKIGKDVGLVHNPEFLREGHAWEDFTSPDRIVIGESDKRSGDKVEKLYRDFSAPVLRVSLNCAEFIKYLSNSFLATLISFSNEMSVLAYKLGNVDISKAFKILHLDKRWYGLPSAMTTYVFPGCGFGGYCLPKDTKALKMLSRKVGHNAAILDSVIKANGHIKEFLVDMVISKINKSSRIGILGLSFKPNSDDVRESPSKDIIERLIKKGYKKILVYDPEAMENFRKFNLRVEYANTLSEAISKSDCLLLLTAWDEFKRNKGKILKKKTFDLRYMFGGFNKNECKV